MFASCCSPESFGKRLNLVAVKEDQIVPQGMAFDLVADLLDGVLCEFPRSNDDQLADTLLLPGVNVVKRHLEGVVGLADELVDLRAGSSLDITVIHLSRPMLKFLKFA